MRHECPDCGVVFGTQRMLTMSPAELAAEYQLWFRKWPHWRDNTEDELKLLQWLKPAPGERYLNWGCGHASRTSTAAGEQGLRLDGFDPYAPGDAPWLLRHYHQLGQYDGIMSNNVLEHFQDPIRKLRVMASHLHPDAFMVHRTGCYEYRYEGSRLHMYFFLGKSVEVMAERAGLVAVRTDDPWIILYRKLH